MKPESDTPGRAAGDASTILQFDDNRLLPLLFGEFDQNLARVEQELGVSISSRGNRAVVAGDPGSVTIARNALNALYDRLTKGLDVDAAEVDAAVRLALAAGPGTAATPVSSPEMITPRRHISARSPGQRVYIEALQEKELVFGLGPAGTGKTYLAVAIAVSHLIAGRVDRIILSRPAVEAGERLGFLPGDLREKVDPYLRPLYDALHDMLPADQVLRRMNSGEIEVAPLAFMRGRTLSNAFVILDEAQNATRVQMKMFLTRLGENSHMVVTGDLSQIDLPENAASGLAHAVRTVEHVEGVAVVRFTDADVVRHPLVTRIVQAYDRNPDDSDTRLQKPGGGR